MDKIFYSERGGSPTILIDLKEFERKFYLVDEGGLIIGGRFAPINEQFEFFFDEIKKADAKLVFFVRLTEGDFKNINRYEKVDYIYTNISFMTRIMKKHAGDKSKNLRPTERLRFNLMKLCNKFGEVFINYDLDKGAILAYARQHSDVMALITRSTEYFALNADFDYWSVTKLNVTKVEILKLHRQKIMETLQLNLQQMQLLSAISANKLEINREKNSICKNGEDLFSGTVSYVKKQEYGPNGYDISEVAAIFREGTRNDIKNQYEDVLSANSYDGSWTSDTYDTELLADLAQNDENFSSVMQFCKNNGIYFAYKLINESISVPKDLLNLSISFRQSF